MHTNSLFGSLEVCEPRWELAVPEASQASPEASPVSSWLPVPLSPSPLRPSLQPLWLLGDAQQWSSSQCKPLPTNIIPRTLPGYLCSRVLFYTTRMISIKIPGQKSVQNKISTTRYKYLTSPISSPSIKCGESHKNISFIC